MKVQTQTIHFIDRVHQLNYPPRRVGKGILVPLTTSLYVRGTIADTQNVIVDVGTGFYVEKVAARS